MLGSTESSDSTTTWKILIMDKVTVKVMGMSCKMADITDRGVSLVEELFKRREPLPSMHAIYFIQPLKENVIMLLSDMSGRCPLYKKAYVYFSTPIPKELTNYVKNDASILPRIGALREMNLEFFAIDNQAFITEHEMALEDLYGANAEKSGNECLNAMAIRVATAIASLKELPFVRYQAAKSTNASSSTDQLNSTPKKLANAVWDILSKYKASVPDYPKKETCDLLILDRSVDQIAPVIHEWTYDCMIHDLLDLDGNKYVYEAPRPGGAVEKKECLLDENDPIWLELRHTHIADASERLHDKMSTFVAKNKAAQFQTSRDGGEVSTRDLQKMVQSLPQYTEQMDKLSLHVEMAGKINTIIRENGLRDIGQLEQDLVFGDAGAKEVMNLLRANQDATPEDKLRLLMIYASTYPEKFDGENGNKLMQLAKLSPEDMKAVENMMYLGQIDPKKAASAAAAAAAGGGFSLKFDNNKNAKKPAARKEKEEEEAWALMRFYPMMEELIKKLDKGELSKDEYPLVNEPQTNLPGPQNASGRTSAGPTSSRAVKSKRTATWAKSTGSNDGSSNDSALKTAPATDFKKMGQRIYVFIIGGATRSELRVAHTLTAKLKREVILGTTSMLLAPHFITKLKLLTRRDA